MHNALSRGLSIALAGCLVSAAALSAASDPDPRVQEYLRLPLSFERQGQGAAERYVARGQGYTVGIDGTKATIGVVSQEGGGKDFQRRAVSLEFAGGRRVAAFHGPALPGKVNRILGNDPSRWETGLATFERVTYPGIYPGIDVAYYGNQQQLEFDLVVKPGADPRTIRLKVRGAGKLSIDGSGALDLGEAAGGVRIALPRIYQDVNGAKKNVAGHYAIVGRDEVAFRVDRWDRTRALVIDPTIVYSALFGGGLSSSGGYGIAVGSQGNILIAGYTYAADFPTVNPVQNHLNGSSSDVFVTKINAAGTALIYSTYLGGASYDSANALALDTPTGSAWVTGYTQSSDFPVLNAAQPTYGGNSDAFVAMLNAAGVLQFSTYLGGNSYDYGYGVAVDSAGNGYVTGSTNGAFPTTAGVVSAVSPGSGDAFVTKYSPAGIILYSTLLGGSSSEAGSGIAVDSSGNAYVTGYSYSNTFTGAPAGGAQASNNGDGDAFVAKLNANATGLVYFTFLGGTAFDQGKAIAVDGTGNAYIGGQTNSTGLATAGAAYTTLAGGTDGFVAKLNAAGTAFSYVSYLGGGRVESLTGLAVDGSGNAYVTGYTDSVNFPTVSPLQSTLPGNGISLFGSSNSGGSWSGFDSNIPGAVVGISINPSGSSAVVLTELGIYRTVNGGASWSQQFAQSFSSYGSFVVRSPVAPGTIYATVCCSQIYKSTDDGVTWRNAGNSSTGSQASGLVADPLTATTVYLFGSGSPYVSKSTDGGATWAAAATGLPASGVASVVATTDGALYAVTQSGAQSSGMYKSTNQGASWTAVNTGLPPTFYAYYANSLSASGTTVYFAWGTIYKTTNGGASWAAIPASVGAYEIAASPQNASILYAFTYNNTVQESTDGGTTFGAAGTGLPATVFYYNSKLVVDPGNNANVFVVAPVNQAAFVAKINSTGSALTWSTYLGGTSSTYAYAIATDGAGNAFVTGNASGGGFPITSVALPSGTYGAFLTKISDATAACSTLTVTPGSQTVSSYGQTMTFSVVAPSGCAWTASSNQAASTITSGAAGTGSGIITLQLSYNSNNTTLATVLTVNSQSITITQPGSSCSFAVDKSSYPVTAAGGAVAVALTATAGCPWSVTNNYSGAISFTSASSGTGSATINLTVTPNLSSLTRNFYLSVGNTQIQLAQASNVLAVATSTVSNGVVGTGYSVTLAASGGTAPYSNWTVASGSLPPGLTLNAATGVIGGTPTTSTGSPFSFAVTVKDAANNVSAAQSLSIAISAAPAPSIGSIANGADFSAPPLAPGSLAAIFGSNLASSTANSSSTPLPFTLAGASVSVNGFPAAILFASPTQINFQIPYEVTTGTANLTVTNGASTSSVFQFAVVLAAPGIFPGLVENQNFSLNTAANPSAPGGTAIVYFTGAGAATPAVADGAGAPSSPLSTLNAATSVTIGGLTVSTPFIGLAPGLVGYAQANIQVPAGLLAGSYPLIVTANGRASQPAPFYVSGAAPSVASVTPNTATAGSASTPVTIAGGNFGGGSVVKWTTPGGQVTTINPGLIQAAQIAATIPSALLTTAGTAQIAISNGLGTLSNQVPFTIATGIATTTTLASSANPAIFGHSVTLTATVSPSAASGSVTFYDGTTVLGTSTLTGGHATLTTSLLSAGARSLRAWYLGGNGYAPGSSAALSQTVNALPGNGFAAAVNYGAGSQPWSIATGDFNGDGKADMAVVFVGNGVEVMLGNGDGTFQAPTTYSAGVAPQSVAVGDFNGDGKTDLIVGNANCNQGNGTVSVLLGTGTGTFNAAVNYAATATCVVSVAAGDFNGDGRPDVAAVAQNGTLNIFLGNGDGTLRTAVSLNAGTSANFVAVDDFNNDGNADLAVYANNGVIVLLGNGDGTFQTAINTGAVGGGIATGDFNGDGKIDLAVTNGGISVLLGNGDGTFQTPVNYASGTSSQGNVAVGDFNGDGKADLAFANNSNNSAGILLGNGDGTFLAPVYYATGAYPLPVAVGDFNGDGRADLAVGNLSPANLSAGNVSILLGAVPLVSVSTSSLQSAILSSAYSQTLIAANGTPPYSHWTVASGTLPPGLTLTATTGVISGTPTTATGSPFTFTVTVQDSLGHVSAGQSLSITVATTAIVGSVQWNGNPVPGATLQLKAAGNYYNLPVLASTTAGADGSFVMANPPSGQFSIYAVSPSSDYWLFSSTSVTVTAGQKTSVGVLNLYKILQLISPASGATGVTLTPTLQWVAFPGATSYMVEVYDNSSSANVFNQSTAATQITVSPALLPGHNYQWSVYASNANGQIAYYSAWSFTVVAAPPLTFDAIPNQIFGVSPFPIAAQASSGLAVGFTSTTPAVCKTASGMVMLLSAGTCSITASSSGATSVSRSFTVSLAHPSDSFAPAAGSPFAVTGYPNSVAVGDFNGDGIQDLVTADVNVLLGNGSGGFTVAAGSPFPGYGNAVVVGDFNGDGIQDLATVNRVNNNVTVLLGNGSAGFAAAVGSPFTVGSSPIFLAVGDFNGDGIQDLVTANEDGNNVTVLLGNGSGGFAPAAGSPFTVGSTPIFAVVGDFNGDGIQDLATANYNSSNVTVLLGNNSGGFTQAPGSPFAVGANPYSLVVGDFNRDGVLDLATANSSSNNVTVLLGNGSGGFTAATGSPFAAGAFPAFVTVGDFNGDGFQDLAAANLNGSNLTVLLGNGSGGFSAQPGSPLAVGSGTGPRSVAVGDFNGDGVQDLATANSNTGNVTVLLGFLIGHTSQTITFAPLSNVTYGGGSFTISATASSGLAVSFASTTSAVCRVVGSTVTIVGTGTCSITASQAGSATYSAATPVVRSFAVTISTQTSGSATYTYHGKVYATVSSSSFTTSQSISGSVTLSAPLAANLPYQTAISRILTYSFSDGLNTWDTTNSSLNTGAVPTISASTDSQGNINAWTIVLVGDAGSISNGYLQTVFVPGYGNNTDAVGNLPIGSAYNSSNPGTWTVSQAPQTVTFDAIPNQIFGVSPFPIAAQSNSGVAVGFTSTTPAVCKTASGLVQLLSVGTCSITASSSGATSVTRSFTVTKAKVSGSFIAATGSPFATGSGAYSVAVGDFNGDGLQDVAVANESSSNVTVLLGNGSGGFTQAAGSPFAVGSTPYSVVAGDFNGDGVQDLATANGGASNVTVLLGNGSGGFTAAPGSPFAVGSTPWTVVVGDFNGDGIQDLATANYGSSNVTVLLGNGLGGFTPSAGSPFAAVSGANGIAVGDFNGDGIQDLATANYGSGDVTVLLGNGSGGFTAAAGSPFATGGSESWTIAVGDFNGDGIQDLATANTGSNNVTVLLGNGLGGFTAATGSPFAVGGGPLTVAVGDFNGDGIQDLVTANYRSNNLTVLLGNGSGGFTAATGSPLAVGVFPSAAAVGDFNGDGIPDLVAANQTSSNVTVLLGLVVGNTSQTITFAAPGNVTYGISPFAISATASSGLAVNFASTTSGVCTVAGTTVTIVGGGSCSIVASQAGNATYAAAATVQQSFTVNQAPQTITFSPLSNVTYGVSPFTIGATASSGLAVSFTSTSVCSVSSNTVTILAPGTCSITAHQNGNTNYAGATPVSQSFTISAGGATATITSLTVSANPSVFGHSVQLTATLSPSAATGKVTFYYGTTVLETETLSGGNATLSTSLLPTGSQKFKAYYLGDTTHVPSVSAGASQTVNAIAETGLAAAVNYAAGTEPRAFAFGDFNGDGKTDMAAPNLGSSNLDVFLGNGDGTFQAAVAYTTAGSSFSIVAADFNGDGVIDLAAGSESGSVQVLLGNGDGTFRSAVSYTAGTTPTTVVAADFNGDGRVDLAVTNLGSNNVSFFRGNGDGTFQTAVNYPAGGTGPIALTVGDFNGDGVPDLATANQSTNNVSILLGNGDGTFQAAVNYAAGALAYSIATGDFNGDGKADLAVANTNGNNVSVLLGNGDGTFQATVNYAAGTGPRAIAVGDVNGDGKADLAVADNGGSSVFVLLGNGDGTFQSAISYAAGTTPTAIAIGDFNADGRADLAVANYNSNNVSILLGVGGTQTQTISFAALSNQTLGTSPFTITASASSGLPVSFASTTTGVCTVSGSTVTLVAVGTCSISASQAGNANYGAATPVTQSFTVSATSQTITFGVLSNVTFGAAPFGISATASSGLTVSFASTTTPVCTVSGSTVTVVGAGTCSITASQAGNANFGAAPNVTQSFTVNKASQTITFPPLSDQPLGTSPFTITATASSGLSPGITSNTPGVCSLSGSILTLIAAGTCSLTASLGGDSNYNPAPSVTRTFTVTAPPATTVTLSLADGIGVPGQTVQIAMQIATTGASTPAGFQADLNFDSTKLTFVSASAGAQTTNAGKSLSTNTLPNGDVRLLVTGFNQTAIANGVVAYAKFTVSSQFTSGSTVVTPKNCSSTDANGSALATPCTAGTIRTATCDINLDGTTNVVDVQLIINEALGVAPAVHDLNGDGVVNVVDVQIVINAALGLGCNVP